MQFPPDLKPDPYDIEERGVLRDPRDGKVRSRVGILLSIYFLEGWKAQKRQALVENLTEYLELFADGITHYQPYGDGNAKRLTAYKGAGLPDDYRHIVQIEEGAPAFLHMVGMDRREPDDPSLYRFIAFGHEKVAAKPLSGMKVHFPPRFVFEDPARFMELISRWCERLGAIHGSCGLGALSRPGAEMMEDAYHYPWLMQYPGLDYDAMGAYWAECEEGGYEKPRTSNWLTILGNANIEALGGENDGITDRLSPEVEMHRFFGGLILKAGRLPVLGTKDTDGIPDTYRSVARLIQPIRFTGYQYNVMKLPRPMLDLDRKTRLAVTLDWLSRFD